MVDFQLLQQTPLVITVIVVAFEFCAIIAAFHAVMHARTSQGAIAWIATLILFPFGALPLYLVLGRGKFTGYVRARRGTDARAGSQVESFRRHFASLMPSEGRIGSFARVLEKLSPLPFSGYNSIRLLIDGEETFHAIFRGIEEAKSYVLVQYYIVEDDAIGGRMKDLLKKKAADGIPVYFLVDAIGCHGLADAWLDELRGAGVTVRIFRASKGLQNPFQINFRNHRKIVVADGRRAYLGGLNVGDRYLGRSSRFGHWRDTHIELEGPAVLSAQMAFLEDWNWAAGEIPPLGWNARKSPEGEAHVLVLPTGPADRLETCALFFSECINRSRTRVWIASPYFVPDSQIMTSLQLAALRGVDVRIMLPGKPDHLLVYLASFSFIKQVESVGVKFFRYEEGFLHQKVILVDDEVAGVGTANLDNRSFRLNFEITAVVTGEDFAAKVSAMLEDDFTHCRPVHAEEYDRRPFWFRVAVQSSRLFAPVL